MGQGETISRPIFILWNNTLNDIIIHLKIHIQLVLSPHLPAETS